MEWKAGEGIQGKKRLTEKPVNFSCAFSSKLRVNIRYSSADDSNVPYTVFLVKERRTD